MNRLHVGPLALPIRSSTIHAIIEIQRNCARSSMT